MKIDKYYRSRYYNENREILWNLRNIDQKKRISDQNPISNFDFNTVNSLKILDSLSEPSYQEVATTGFISDYFLFFGFKMNSLSGTDNNTTELVFGDLESSDLTFRCDLDAVSMGDRNYLHCCGHAVNMSSMLSLAKLISNHKLKDKISFIFQPAEEGPGNEIDGYIHPKKYGGGQYLRAKEIYARVNNLISCHIDTSLEENEVRITEGAATAAAYRFKLNVKGKPAHAALPWQGINPVFLLNKFLNKCLTLNAQFNDLNIANSNYYGLISPTQIFTKDCELNSLSELGTISGISRIVGIEVLTKFKNEMANVGAEIELEAPPVINDINLVRLAKNVATQLNFVIRHEPARFRDETAWAGEFNQPWADPTEYPKGCDKILHFFTPGGKKCGPLHSYDFKSVQNQVKWQKDMLFGIIMNYFKH